MTDPKRLRGNGVARPTPEHECADIPWTCKRCQTLLGYVETPKRDVVRLKYKDNYIYVGEAVWVKVICRSCAAENRIFDEERVAMKAKESAGATADGAPTPRA